MASVTSSDLNELDLYFRAANYITAAQLYLRDNVLLSRPLAARDIKDPIVGHWGTAPGINFIYTHLNRMVRNTSRKVLLVVGPGHGAPAIIANLFLEGTMERYYPELSRTEPGLRALVRAFGAVDGLPTELSPVLPGTIHLGGELGHALAISYGTALDRPELTTVCIVGDGEAETGPTATAWHSCRYLHPALSGNVLPILHLNGVRLTSPSLLSTLDADTLKSLFLGYGYEARFVGPNHAQMAVALDWAFRRFASLRAFPSRGAGLRPLIVLKTLKGWTGPREFAGQRIEGTARSHKAPIAGARTQADARGAVEDWLRSYGLDDIFDTHGRPRVRALAILPARRRRLGMVAATLSATPARPLKIPSTKSYSIGTAANGALHVRPSEILAGMLGQVFDLNRRARSFRLFSPDELDSNMFSSVLKLTGRSCAVARPDLDGQLEPDGRIMEVLSEHLTNGWMQGYQATGGHGVLVSYECFLPVVSSAISQYIKFLSEASRVAWRPRPASLNYFVTSLGWHNNYSHQNPDVYTTLAAKYGSFVRLLFPPDANTLLACMTEALESDGRVNVIAAAKTLLPVWLTSSESQCLAREGVVAHDGLSDADPDVVFAACGDYAARECVNALLLLRAQSPAIKSRLVLICDLTALGEKKQFRHALTAARFSALFPTGRPTVALFGGYPLVMKGLLGSRPEPERFRVHGYCDVGTTSTCVDLHIRNGASRYDLVLSAAAALHERCIIDPVEFRRLSLVARRARARARQTIRRTRKDPVDLAIPVATTARCDSQRR